MSFSPYPRQIQDLGAPVSFIEWATDFFVPRGYVQVIANGTVGMLGISDFACAQLAAAVDHQEHLTAIFAPVVTADLYELVWRHGLQSSSFVAAWLTAVGVMAARPKALGQQEARHGPACAEEPAIHKKMANFNGEVIVALVKGVIRTPGRPGTIRPALAARLRGTPDPRRVLGGPGHNARPLDFAGDIELHLDASITALDAGWVTVLYDVAPDGTATSLTGGSPSARRCSSDSPTPRSRSPA